MHNANNADGAMTVEQLVYRGAVIVMSRYASDRQAASNLWFDVNAYYGDEVNGLFVEAAHRLHNGQRLFRQGLLFSFTTEEARRYAYQHCKNAYQYWAAISGAIENGHTLPLSLEALQSVQSK